MEYIYQIFKEIVFSRPLPYCYALVSNLMMIFMKSTTYLRKLCINSSIMFIVLIVMFLYIQFLQKKNRFIIIFIESMAVNNWKGSLHFIPGKALFF